MNKRKMDDKRAEELFEAERALAFVDPGGLGEYEVGGGFNPLLRRGALQASQAGGRLVVLAAAWACGGLVEEYIAGGVEE
jgi:hypothetical protein